MSVLQSNKKRITEAALEVLRSRVSFRDVFRKHFPDRYREHGNSLCPFHEDRDPSFQVDEGMGYCHAGCGRKDAVDITRLATGLSFPEAFHALAAEHGLDTGEDTQDCRDVTVEEHFRQRGISRDLLEQLRPQMEILRGNGKYPPSIAFILTDFSGGKPLGKQFIPLAGGEKKFSRGLPAKEAFFRMPGPGKRIVTEGIFDSISVRDAIPESDAMAILGASFTAKLSALLESPDGPEIVLFLDNDEAGRKATLAAIGALEGACKVVDWSRCPKKAKDPNDILKSPGGEHIIRHMVRDAIPAQDWTAKNAVADRTQGHHGASSAAGERQRASRSDLPGSNDWSDEQKLFPRISFPWEILPQSIAVGFDALAKSCATSSSPIPGQAFATMASCLGRKFSLSPKDGWEEPMIVYCGDIRVTGAGKSPLIHSLCSEIYRQQAVHTRAFEQEEKEYRTLSKQEKDSQPPPKERGFFLTDMTVEGMRFDLQGHPTGGLLLILDELSSFVSAQNQYKSGKGSDREAWLRQFDGKPIRVGRAGRTVSVTGARASIIGGIQPIVFCRAFGGEDGIFLHDGTIYRFIFTYDPLVSYPLDATIWGEEHRKEWSSVLSRAIHWAMSTEDPVNAILDIQAQQRFFSWRNEIHEHLGILNPLFRGFLPKAYSYALRLAGIIHAIHRFHGNREPDRILTQTDMERGIRAVMFYLGQAVDAMRLLEDTSHNPLDERAQILARCLDSLRSDTDQGRLSVSFVRERYNSMADPRNRFPDNPRSKAFGLFLREHDLTVSEGLMDFKGQRRVKCLLWDEKTESFTRDVLHLLQDKEICGLQDGEDGNGSSPSSANRTCDKSPLEIPEDAEVF